MEKLKVRFLSVETKLCIEMELNRCAITSVFEISIPSHSYYYDYDYLFIYIIEICDCRYVIVFGTQGFFTVVVVFCTGHWNPVHLNISPPCYSVKKFLKN